MKRFHADDILQYSFHITLMNQPFQQIDTFTSK